MTRFVPRWKKPGPLNHFDGWPEAVAKEVLEAPVGERTTTAEGRTVNDNMQEFVAQGECLVACMGEEGQGHIHPKRDSCRCQKTD
jgi:hypothetical protein